MPGIESDVETVLEELELELVSVERGGGRRRPLIRVRIDRPGDAPGRSSITAADCARASRALERMLDERPDFPATCIVEVSSPGVERPLVRRSDFERFAGERVLLYGHGPLAGGSKRVEGVLVGLAGDEEARVLIEADGERLEVPWKSIAKAHLVYRWRDDLEGATARR